VNCRDVERRLSAYLDGELDESAASALRGHLRLCEACRRTAEAHAAVIDAVANLQPAEPPTAMWDGVLARLGEAEVADAQRPSYWLWWRRVRPHLLPATALIGAAATFSLWMYKRGEQPLADAIASARPAAPAVVAALEPAERPAAAGEAADVTDALADDTRVLDDGYRAAAEELAALAAEERPAWTAPQAVGFDARLTALRAAVDAAAVGSESRERAWQDLIGFLQRVATGDRLVAVVEEAR
jgi:anti-sigma factor RsiW